MPTFGERLKELRLSRGLTQSSLAQIIHVTDRAIRQFESNQHSPNLVFLNALADYFGCSLDYLTARVDDPAIHSPAAGGPACGQRDPACGQRDDEGP
jgi:transcriptional regulator with XRE-family HTH domain